MDFTSIYLALLPPFLLQARPDVTEDCKKPLYVSTLAKGVASPSSSTLPSSSSMLVNLRTSVHRMILATLLITVDCTCTLRIWVARSWRGMKRHIRALQDQDVSLRRPQPWASQYKREQRILTFLVGEDCHDWNACLAFKLALAAEKLRLSFAIVKHNDRVPISRYLVAVLSGSGGSDPYLRVSPILCAICTGKSLDRAWR